MICERNEIHRVAGDKTYKNAWLAIICSACVMDVEDAIVVEGASAPNFYARGAVVYAESNGGSRHLKNLL